MEEIRRSLEPHRRLLRPGLARRLFGKARPAANKSLPTIFRELTAGAFAPEEVRAKVFSHIASAVRRRMPASRADAQSLGVRLVGSFYKMADREVGRLERQAAKIAPDSLDDGERAGILQRRGLFMNLRRS